MSLKSVLLCALALLMSPGALLAEEILILAGAVVDPIEGRVEHDVLLAVEDGRIARISPGATPPADGDFVDLSDRFVLPGLFDCHSHLCSMVPIQGESMKEFNRYLIENSFADRVLQAVPNAREMLHAGFTTVRDAGDCGEWGDISVRSSIQAGRFEGPTALVSGKIIAPYGGQHFLNPEQIHLADVDYLVADSLDEMRKAVRKNLHFGVDWIKIVVDGQKYIYTEADIRGIVEESERAGVHVCAHVMSDDAARNAILAGVRSLEHGFMLSDDTLNLAKEHGVWLVGTDFSREIFEVYGFPQWHGMVVDRLRRAHRLGVKMAFGADVVVEVPGHDRGSAIMTLLDTWVAAEIPNLDILRAMTIDAARLLELDDSLGSIEVGKTADLIAVSRNPLEDILGLREVSFVMKAGRVVVD